MAKPETLLEISKRLKAARFLAGTVVINERSGVGEVQQIKATELAKRPPVAGQVAVDRIQAYEQRRIPQPRPMELRVLAEGLGVPPEFLLAPLRDDPAYAALDLGSADGTENWEAGISRRLGMVETELSLLVGVLTGDSAKAATVIDAMTRAFERAMSLRSREAGRPTRRVPRRPGAEESEPAA